MKAIIPEFGIILVDISTGCFLSGFDFCQMGIKKAGFPALFYAKLIRSSVGIDLEPADEGFTEFRFFRG
jgi:hypothetical protein